MAEYIDRDFALDVVKRTSGDYAAAFSEIAHEPAADVAPMVHGHWEAVVQDGVCHYSGRCSVCWTRNYIPHPTNAYYCPNCGAKMDETIL